ncbi:FkbM family methyltransferase [Vulcaniibacterium tengchongense]|uniref:FkbM family methyltransferase n=1 Tax=Vulcaniibacterium tengchongense TaxID=1273429 RepID=UPI0013152289|nr:FkbM family methyltransferase [Vulcaniibacterium tengchongense]
MKIGNMGWNSFEHPMPDIFWRAVAASSGIVVDIGANTGFYTLLAAAARRRGQVWVVEPDPKVLPVLEKNITINQLGRRVKLFRVALSDYKGTADLFIPLQDHGLVETSSSLERTFRAQHSEVITTNVTTLDALAGGVANLFSKVSIIKIDVEGHEAPVFRGAIRTIRRHRPLIFVEILDRADYSYFDRFLQENGYVDLRLLSNGTMIESEQVDFDPQAWNHVFVPEEAKAAFRAMVSPIV